MDENCVENIEICELCKLPTPKLIEIYTHLWISTLCQYSTHGIIMSSQTMYLMLRSHIPYTCHGIPPPGNQQIQGLSFVASYDAPLSFLQQMLDSAPSSFAASIPTVLEPPHEQDMSSLAKEDVKMAVVDDDCAGKMSRRTTASATTDGDENNVIADAHAAADALVNDEKNTLDNEEFARAMGPDENFFGLGNSDAIADVFDGGDIFEDQLY